MITSDEYYIDNRNGISVVKCARDNSPVTYYEGTYDECVQWINSKPGPDPNH